MYFWWFMLIYDVIIPITMAIAGRVMWKHCPKQINGFLGYRTSRSMKNMDTWKFAHEYCGRLWWRVGLIMLVPSVAALIPFYKSNQDTITIVGSIISAVQLAILIISVIPTELALKSAFNDDGTRR